MCHKNSLLNYILQLMLLLLFQEFNIQVKPEGKTSSLRSVRVKPERLRENAPKENKLSETSPADTEVKVKTEIKTEPSEEQQKPAEPSNYHEKDVEPVTTAVAPVVQTAVPEKSLSPAEGKDDMAVMTTEGADKQKSSEEKMPCKPKTPEGAGLERNMTNEDGPLIHEVKKRKLDILKEGGLEVTPVTSFVTPSSVREIRPSVIHQAVPRLPDKHYMPPPMSNTVPAKRVTSQQNNAAPLQNIPKPQYPHVNGQSPPKVVQSRSIYSYSEKTVYGNPNQFSQQSVHSPRFAGAKPTAGDILDLRVTSPQKPVVEIMRVPTMPLNRTSYKKHFPTMEGKKIGSNLEITLVGPQNKPPYSVHNQLLSKYNPGRKRTFSESYTNNKYTRSDENGRLPRPFLPPKEVKPGGLEITVPYVKNPGLRPEPAASHVKPPSTSKPPSVPQMFPGYLPFLPSANKNLLPYNPLVDSMYYQALQNSLYQLGGAPTPPMLPVHTPEQLQMFNELSARARYPYLFPDGGPAAPATDGNKKL